MAPARIALLLVICFHNFAAQTNAMPVVWVVAKEVPIGLYRAWKLVNENIDLSKWPPEFVDNTEKELFSEIRNINSKLEDLKAAIIDNTGNEIIKNKLDSLPERIQLEFRRNELLDYRAQVESNYKKMQEYIMKLRDYERLTLTDFAHNVISHDSNSVVNLIEKIQAFTVPQGRGVTSSNFFQLLAKHLQDIDGDMICNIRQSPQQYLSNLYETILLTQIQGYTMEQFSYMLLRLYGKGNFTAEIEKSRKQYEQMTHNLKTTMRTTLENVSRELMTCDPKKHVKGETYEQITNLLQGYIQNEVSLNKKGKCWNTCSDYKYSKNYGCTDKYCKKQRTCSGNILSCEFIASKMTVCLAGLHSDRRYEYIKYENGEILGREHECSQEINEAESWKHMLFWQCSYCFCFCDQQGGSSDRYFNMKSVLSNIQNNKVVTGLRFVKNNRIIHMQIQEGELLPMLKINSSTLAWKPVDNYTIDERKIFDGQEFHMFTSAKRQVDLDDLQADEGYILTGVRFKETGSHLTFEIYTTKFDFDSGKLQPEISKWKDNLKTSDSRTEVHLDQPDIPTRSSASKPTSHSNQYIKFTHSDIAKDVAQTTVPYLDAQKVESWDPVPLAGAGIFHKGQEGFGGFIAPKVITYDVTKYLKVPEVH